MHDGELLLPAHIGFLYHGANEQANSSMHATGQPCLTQTPQAASTPAGATVAPMRTGEATVSPDPDGRVCVVLPDEPVKLDDLLDAVVRAALDRFAGNKSKAADYLGISRFALYRRIQAWEKR
jgi:DNA-binding NtrC family response regulator